jgi:hypothetical protein
MRTDVVEVVIKEEGKSETVITLEAMRGAYFGSLLSEMGINIYRRGKKK